MVFSNMLDTSRFITGFCIVLLQLGSVTVTCIPSTAIWQAIDRCHKMGLVSVIRPKNMTGCPVFEHRMDPLSEGFASMRIQDAIDTRLQASAPGGLHCSGDTVPRRAFA